MGKRSNPRTMARRWLRAVFICSRRLLNTSGRLCVPQGSKGTGQVLESRRRLQSPVTGAACVWGRNEVRAGSARATQSRGGAGNSSIQGGRRCAEGTGGICARPPHPGFLGSAVSGHGRFCRNKGRPCGVSQLQRVTHPGSGFCTLMPSGLFFVPEKTRDCPRRGEQQQAVSG